MVVALTSINFFFKGGKIMDLKKEEIDKTYNQIAEELTISESVYESSKASYDELAKYLSNNIGYNVNIYPQGSMALGTTIKTITKNDDYDLDVVCEVEGNFDNPKKLKNLIGDALKNSGMYKKMLDNEGKRCWTLNYSSKNFHLDILPATPISSESTKIIITNKDENTKEYSFKTSNPSFPLPVAIKSLIPFSFNLYKISIVSLNSSIYLSMPFPQWASSTSRPALRPHLLHNAEYRAPLSPYPPLSSFIASSITSVRFVSSGKYLMSDSYEEF